ncbi:hypothetical protein DFH06DRAFT_1145326 [Mycena polygramma]|nr:hypothetical protein DFH06DRAFT_1145326 [Mycena polygramma]
MPIPSLSDRELMHALEVEEKRRDAFRTQYPHFLLKPKLDKTQPNTGWDPCSVRVFAPMSWKRDEHKADPAWTVIGCKLDGVYVDPQQKDRVIIEFPHVQIRTHATLNDALFDHYIRCQASHDECLQLNALKAEIVRAEAEFGIEPDSEDNTFDEPGTVDVYLDIASRASSMFNHDGTVASILADTVPASSASTSSSRAATYGGSDTESHVDTDSDTEVRNTRDTPAFLIPVKESEWDEFIGGLLSR